MITREMLITVSPTPREIECEIWNMDSTEQADLILAMSQRYEIECGNVCVQSQAISDDLKKLLNREERIKVRRLFQHFLAYFGEEGQEF